MTDLVTGGGGFIGHHLVELLLKRGETVRVLDLEPGLGADRSLPPQVEVVVGSVTDDHAVREAMGGVRRVFHLAGNPNLWARRKDVFERVNHHGTRLLLAEAARQGVARFVHTSSGAILFRRPKRGNGGDRPTLSDMPGPYCRSKFLAEQEALAAARRGQPVVVVNPTLPMGPGDRRLTPPTRMIVDFINGDTPAFVDFELNVIDVRDVAAGHLLAAEIGQPGERYLLGSACNHRLSEVLAVLEETTGVPMPRRRVPYILALAVAAVSETIADRFTGKSPKATLSGVRLTRRPPAVELVQPAHALGLKPRPLRETLCDAARWLAAAGHLRRPLPHLQASKER